MAVLVIIQTILLIFLCLISLYILVVKLFFNNNIPIYSDWQFPMLLALLIDAVLLERTLP